MALFSEHFFEMVAIFQVYYFFIETKSHNMTQSEGFTFFDFFFEFLMPISKCNQNGGRDRS
jgi:hypothetical protein